jgi:hypothetical protein
MEELIISSCMSNFVIVLDEAQWTVQRQGGRLAW